MRRRIRTCTLPGFAAFVGVLLLAGAGTAATAQSPAQPGTRAAATGESGPRWQDLSPSQRSSLKPLERDWAAIDGPRKQKWLEIAARYPSLPPAEQQRISARMNEWVKLSPAERGQARLNFQASRQLTPEERQARWQAYQALTPEQRGKLAERATPAASPAAARGNEVQRKAALPARDGVQAKSNIVPNPAYATPPKAVAPTVVQAGPGATTSLMSKRTAPPTHQQPGLPKIAASPGFVDKQTLLPQRGPQGAAAAAPNPKSDPR